MLPVLDYIYAKEVAEDTGVVSNVDISDAKQKYEVIAVGPGRYEYGVLVKPTVKPGDIVYIQKHGEQDTPADLTNKGYALFMASRVMAIEGEL